MQINIDAQLSRIEKATETIMQRRMEEYNFTISAIASVLLQNLAIALSTATVSFLVSAFVLNNATMLSVKIAVIIGAIVFALYTTLLLSKDEIGLIKMVYLLGQLSQWRKIIYLNSVIAQLHSELEASGNNTLEQLKNEIVTNASAYFSGEKFPMDSKAFRYLLNKGLAQLNDDGHVALKAKSVVDLLHKLQAATQQ